MTTLNIGGVPEHFNLAWYLTLKDGAFKKQGINLRWKDFYGGTDEMNSALRNHDIDIAVILTEGIIKDISEGNPSKIIQTFVESPLIWGIHVAHNSKYHSILDLKGTKAAISRYGSGSHLMAYIHAQNNQWDLKSDLKFKVVRDLDGAIQALRNGKADYFMWEKFTTKPLVDNCTFRHLGNCPTPWPCFVIAATEHALKKHKNEIKIVLDIINQTTAEFKDIPNIDSTIANRYDQRLEDVKEWLRVTKWSQNQITSSTVQAIQGTLLDLQMIPKKLDYRALVYNL